MCWCLYLISPEIKGIASMVGGGRKKLIFGTRAWVFYDCWWTFEGAMILILLRHCCCVGYNSMMMILRGTDIKRANKITWTDPFPCLNECCGGCLFGDSFGVVCMMMETKGYHKVLFFMGAKYLGDGSLYWELLSTFPLFTRTPILSLERWFL